MSEFDRRMQEEVAAGERWLATFATAPPSSDGIERVRRAVRGELCRLGPMVSGQRWAAWHGALAAAAGIMLAVTVGWLSTGTSVQPRGSLVAEEIAAWPKETEDEVITLARLDEELSDLEAWSEGQAWDMDGTALYDAFDEVLEDTSNDARGEAGASIQWLQRHSDSEET